MNRRGFARTIGLVIAALVVVGFLWYAAYSPTIGWPVEARRVYHTAGFSVVEPLDWDRQVRYFSGGRTADALRFVPRKAVGDPGYFSVSRLNEPPVADEMARRGYKTVTYDGAPAYEFVHVFKDVPEVSRTIVFERDGAWFDLSLRRPSNESLDSGVWKKYLDSFRTEPAFKATHSHLDTPSLTSQPATRP